MMITSPTHQTLMCLIIPDYGYDTRKKVLKFAHAYKDRDTPLDGIHIDVDLQVLLYQPPRDLTS